MTLYPLRSGRLHFGWILCLLLAGAAGGQSRPAAPRSPAPAATAVEKAPANPGLDSLRQFNAALRALAHKVAPAVVQVQVTGYGSVGQEDGNGGDTAYITRQRSLGSGVIVDPDGYIITNAHVVAGAQRIHVALTLAGDPESQSPGVKKDYDAKLLGVHQETDLALLKIDAKGLPSLSPDHRHAVQQGELVIALGSPEGLENSVTMGVISAVNRQPDPNLPMVFIQTDAPINRGNSGGPLVDVDGRLVGINTFILSSSGGSQGLGFAIPAPVVNMVYQRLRKFGHVDRSEIGAIAETITPLLAEGLRLPVNSGVIISDVSPGGPAEAAGLRIQDIVVGVDGRRIESLPTLNAILYLHPTDEPMAITVLRGKQELTLHVPVLTHPHSVDRLTEMVDPLANLVPKLGVLGSDVDEKALKVMPDLRISTGVIVLAKTAYGATTDVSLKPGDVIHSLNNEPVTSLAELRGRISVLKPGDAVVLQIEREGNMEFVSFELD
jgi:serine protease Do